MIDIIGMIAPALIPALADGLKCLFGKIFGKAVPVTVEDQVKLMSAENERLKAMAELDRPSEKMSTWVADIRGSFRYLLSGVIIVGTFVYVFVPQPDKEVLGALLQLSSSVVFFMIGDRVYINLKSR